jgi:hypothetical protein
MCVASVTPCGGDITGTWTLQGFCGGTAQLMMQCPGASADFAPNVSGTYTFNADGTYSLTLTADESGPQTLPASCLPNIQTCAMLEMSSTMQGLTSSVTSCSGDVSQSCTCTFMARGTLTDNGTYTTAGTSVTMTGTSGPSKPEGFCATGNQLELTLTSNETYLVFTK